MKIFDGHADIWYDVYKKREKNEKNIVKKYHYNRLKSGDLVGGIFIAYLDKNDEVQDKIRMIDMVSATIHEIRENSDIFNIITKKGDFDGGIEDEKKLNVLMGIEGLRTIDTNLDYLEMFYELGFRHATLTWNEENLLGTGVAGDETHGLTEAGKMAVLKMEELGMIVDVSHANEKTFWDIISIATKPIIASHSNSKKLCDHRRNLTDEQIVAIAKSRGVIGINAYKNFVAKDEEKQNLESYVDHIDYIISLVGVDYVGLGFDFCEYLDEGTKDRDTNPENLENASKSQNVIRELEKRGYSQEEIEKIAYKNFRRVIEDVLIS